jgi:hypothetical protein
MIIVWLRYVGIVSTITQCICVHKNCSSSLPQVAVRDGARDAETAANN